MQFQEEVRVKEKGRQITVKRVGKFAASSLDHHNLLHHLSVE